MSIANIKMEAMGLADGESVRVVCPFCNGGTSKEKSCNITQRDDVTLYNCHRAGCLKRGACGGRANFIRIKEDRQPRKQSFTPYEGQLEHLSEEWLAFLAEKIGWTEEHIALARPMYARDEHRVAFPIYGPMGLRRGWVLRSYEASAGRYKALTRMDNAEPHMSYYRKANTNSCVIVEDTPSAVRVAQYADAVAINGGGMGLDYAYEIAAHYPSVVWALDADATQTAIAMHTRFSVLFNESRVMVLERDFKDETEQVLEEKLRWITQ